MLEFANLAQLRAVLGQEDLACSNWIAVDQARIDLFAEATGDHQWIHVDPVRSAQESPFAATVAHGFLSLSLIPMMLEECISIKTIKMGINYGLNKVRFPAPVRAGSRVRGKLVLQEYAEIADGAQLVWKVTVEVEGGDKPVCVAELVTRVFGD